MTTSASTTLKNPKAAELYALAQKAGLVLPEPGINPAQAFMDGAFKQGDPAAHEVTSCVWGLETGLLASTPSELFAAGVWAVNFWRAGQADDRIRPFVVAHALATYAASLEAPAEYFNPWAGEEGTPAALSGAQLGGTVPNTVEAELPNLIAKKARDIEDCLARALGNGFAVDANDLHDVANPQRGEVDAGGEYGDAVAIAAIKLAAARLLADQEPFIAKLNIIKKENSLPSLKPVMMWPDESSMFKQAAAKTPNATPKASESTSLASHNLVPVFVSEILEIAQAGGMADSRAMELYDEIMGCYARVDGSAIEQFRSVFSEYLKNRKLRD